MRDLELTNSLDADKPKKLPKHKPVPLSEEQEKQMNKDIDLIMSKKSDKVL